MTDGDIREEHSRLTDILKVQKEKLDKELAVILKSPKDSSVNVFKPWVKRLVRDLETVVDDEVVNWFPRIMFSEDSKLKFVPEEGDGGGS